jgi:hypothetical protein
MGCVVNNPFWDRDKYRKLTWRERLGWHDRVHAFVRDLLDTKAANDEVTEEYVRHVLHSVRLQRAAQPWIELGRSIVTPLEIFWSTMHHLFERAAADEVPPVIVGDDIVQASQQHSMQQAGQFTNYGGGFSAPGRAPHIPSTAYMAGLTTVGPPLGMPYPGDLQQVSEFEDAGISTGEINAFRGWYLHADGLLHSLAFSDFAWAPGFPIEAPDITPKYQGVHAFKTRELVQAYAASCDGDYPVVFGTVDLWGTVYEHARGYRASHASIEDAPLVTDDDGVTFTPTYDAAKLRKKYGLHDPESNPPTETNSQ